MRKRIIRKNKKRRDPRYFLYEELETLETIGGDDDPDEGQDETPPAFEKEEETEDDKLEISSLSGQQKEGAVAMLDFVRQAIGDEHNLAVQDLESALEGKGFRTEEEQI